MRILNTWTSVTLLKTRHQHLHPLKTTGYTLQEVHCSRSPSSEWKQPSKEEYNFNTHDHTTSHPCLLLSNWNAKTPSKLQNSQTSQRIISTTFNVTFSYPNYTPTTTSTITNAFIYFPHYIFKYTCGATGHHPAKTREITICPLPSEDYDLLYILSLHYDCIFRIG